MAALSRAGSLPSIVLTGVLSATTLSAASGPYLLRGVVTIPPGGLMTMLPGAVLKMDRDAALLVRGTLSAHGTAIAPILITSAAAQPKAGDWAQLHFDGVKTSESVLDYTQISYGSANHGTYGMLSLSQGANITVGNSTFSQGAGLGIWIDDRTRPIIANCLFAGNGSYAIEAPVDDLGLITGTDFSPNQLGIHVRAGTISHAASWRPADAPVVLSGTVVVQTGTSLILAPGTVLKMDRGASILVQGTLSAHGTASVPILITSAATQPEPGDWQGLHFDGTGAAGSVFDHVQLFYGGTGPGSYGMLSLSQGANIAIGNSTLTQGAGLGIWIDDRTRPTIANCLFAGNGSYAIEAPVDDLSLITGIAYGPTQLGMHLRGGSISHSTMWKPADAPLLLSGAVVVQTGTTLTLAPGMVLSMDLGASLMVQGTLLARGTTAAPILITNTAEQPKAGDWQELHFDGTGAAGSVLTFVQISYGSADPGTYGMLSLSQGANITVSNSTFAQGAGLGIWIDDRTRPIIANCLFAGNGSYAIEAPVDDLSLITGTTYGSNQRGIHLRSGAISHSTFWRPTDVPILLSGNVVVQAGSSLTLAPGTVLKMDSDSSLLVQGTLIARGTASARIVITSAAEHPMAGDWQDVRFDGSAASLSVLDYAQISYASADRSAFGAVSVTQDANPTITHSLIAHAAHFGIWVGQGHPTIAFCQFSDNGDASISIPAKDPSRIHDNTLGPGQKPTKVR